jgi:8-oxo-dGTP pyrophosphatase MutT (NUDIX family)
MEDTRTHGLLTEDTVSRMPWTDDFAVSRALRVVQMQGPSKGKDPFQAASAAFEAVITKAIENDTFGILHKRRSEPYKILGARGPVHLQRFAHPLFGIISRGAHLTAYVKTEEGIKIWVPRRAFHLFTYPGKLDSTVAGGIKATDTPMDCIIAEAMEEASLPEDLIRARLRSVGALTYMALADSPDGREKGLVHPDVLYLFDIELPPDVIPTPNDDEVEKFYFWTTTEVQTALAGRQFKPNSAIVMIDFLIRHGIITADNQRHFVDITSRLHRHLPLPTTSDLY